MDLSLIDPIWSLVIANKDVFLQSEILKMTLAFLVAARMHRKWVKKDMETATTTLTEAIEKVSKNVSDSHNAQSKRIDELSERVSNLERSILKT